MAARSMLEDDPLEDFTHREVRLDAVAKRVYVAGTGPAVIVMTEMPGISPHVARFARWVRDAGFTVYMPSLFGRDGAVPHAEEGAAVFRRACISAEFRALAASQSSPVTQWLARAGAPCTPPMRWPRRWCHRHVLHRKLRAHDDAGTLDASARPLPALTTA